MSVTWRNHPDVPDSKIQHPHRPFYKQVFVATRDLSKTERAYVKELSKRGTGDYESTITHQTTRIVVANELPPGGVFDVRGDLMGKITTPCRSTLLLYMGELILPGGRRLLPDPDMDFPKFCTVKQMEAELRGKTWTGPTISGRIVGKCPRLDTIRATPILVAFGPSQAPATAAALPSAPLPLPSTPLIDPAGPSSTSRTSHGAEDNVVSQMVTGRLSVADMLLDRPATRKRMASEPPENLVKGWESGRTKRPNTA